MITSPDLAGTIHYIIKAQLYLCGTLYLSDNISIFGLA